MGESSYPFAVELATLHLARPDRHADVAPGPDCGALRRGMLDASLVIENSRERGMRMKPRSEYLPWTVTGVVLLTMLLLVVWQSRRDESPARQLELKASRVDLVSRMQVALATSSEAERSAVLATTDEDSLTFAGQARTAAAEVERIRSGLATLLATGDHEQERDLLTRFSEDFARLQRIDEQVLRLAVRNTNVKAYALAYGPAADLLGEMEAALSRLVEKHGTSPDARWVLLLATRARIGALHVQTLLPPHIAEGSKEKMDRLEATMAADQRQVRQDLVGLAALRSLAADPDLTAARARFASYLELTSRILALSRENTNVESLSLSLDQQRKAMAVCVDSLNALQQAILEEPILGVTYGRAPIPTR
jgi:hypothetical protein